MDPREDALSMRVRGNRLLRILDHWVGIPLVALQAAVPGRVRPRVVRRVGFLRTAAIGDTLLVSGILRDLRAALPHGDVVLVTGEDNAEAGRLAAGQSARIVAISVRSPLAALRAIRRQRFDVLMDGGQWPRFDALLTALSGARYRVGFRTPGQHRHHGYDAVVDHASDVHELENFRRLATAAGFSSTSDPSIDPGLLAAAPPVADGRHVVFHPWSGGFRGEHKEWPEDRWIRLGERLRDLDARILVSGARSQRSASERLAANLVSGGSAAIAITDLSLAQLGAVIARSLAVISVNTGVMHLAALLGTPTIALDGPTPPHRWGPLGPHVRSVTPDVAGCGYLDLGFEYDGQRTDCMAHISVDAVAAAVHALLRRAGGT